MPQMTKEEILDYRYNQLPDPVKHRIQAATYAAKLHQKYQTSETLDRYQYALKRLLSEAEHYHRKRQEDFGITNLRLARLVKEVRKMLQDLKEE